MSAGDITKKYLKISVNPDTGEISYAEQKYIEDGDGNLHASGDLYRPGIVPPRVPSGNGWADTPTSNLPQIIQDIASGAWTSARKTKYEQLNS